MKGFSIIGAVAAALVLAPLSLAGTITLHPGQATKVGKYHVACSLTRSSRAGTQITLRVGFQVTLGRTKVRCVKLAAPQPVPIPTPTPTPTPAPPLGTRANPYPIGARVQNGSWAVTVNSVMPDAWPAIQAANMFNDPPGAGGQDFMANLTVSYLGTGSADLSLDFGLEIGVVGQGGVEYVDWTNSCGVPPKPREIDYSTVLSGATIGLNVCWQVASSDVATLELEFGRHMPALVWLALH